MTKRHLRQLENKIKKIKDDVIFSSIQKKSLKKRIFNRIEKREAEIKSIIPILHNLKTSITAPKKIKKNLFERIFAPTYIKLNPLSVIINLFSQHKKAWATFTIIIFIFSITFTFTVNPNRTYAIKKAVLQVEKGEVKIKRNGAILTAQQMDLLTEGDIVMTQSDSKATIYFPDESLSRLDSQSEITIEHVILNPKNPADSDVKINVNKGRVWTNVVSLVNEKGSFTVTTPQSTAQVTSKATFDVEVKDKIVNINTIQNEVKIKTNNSNNNYTIKEGHSAVIEKNKPTISRNPKNTNPENKKWIEENMADDSKYIAELQEKKTKTMVAGLNSDKSSSNSEKKTIDALEKAEQKFKQAEALFTEGKNEEAHIMLDEYKSQLNQITEKAKQLKQSDPENANSIILEIKDILDTHQKELSVFPETASITIVKNTVTELKETTDDDNNNESAIDPDIKFPEEIESSNIKTADNNDPTEFENLLDPNILDQTAATPNTEAKQTHKAIIDLYFEVQNLDEKQ